MAPVLGVCEVCGLDDFMLDGGFYFCTECGTQLLNIREVVDDIEEPDGFPVTQSQQETAGQRQRITSWEQMNYFLHGLTDRLIELGVSEELKPVVLQIWCAYLRTAEIAFFSKQQRQRPRVSLANKRWDMRLMFNRIVPKRSRSKKKPRQHDLSTYRGNRKMNQQLLIEQHEAQMLSQNSDLDSSLSTLSTSMQSSNSQQAPLGFKFNTRARKRLIEELRITEEHVEWHEQEAPMDTPCHSITPLRPKQRVSKFEKDDWSNMHRKPILISILALALNQIGSPVLIADIWRWIDEGHLPFFHLQQYLPEGLDPSCYADTIVQLSITYQGYLESRNISSLLCRDLGIEPVEPDLSEICLRYLHELALPLDLLPYITKIIAIGPPINRDSWDRYFPNYEIHAMKYILFSMKLLFGLDGAIETKLDDATKTLNELIVPSCNLPKLFVWEEWQRFVAMRRVILEQVHYPTNHHRSQTVATRPVDNELFLDFFSSRVVPDDDNTTGYQGVLNQRICGSFRERQFKNLHTIIASETDKHVNPRNAQPSKHVTFDHTMQPHKTYLTEVLKMYDEDQLNVFIPEYMRVDHSSRTVVPFINPVNLKRHLLEHEHVRLISKRTKISLKHIRMEKYNTHRTNVEVYLVKNKLSHILEEEDLDPNGCNGTDHVAGNILDYINARAEAKRGSSDELLHKVFCQNAIEELESDMRASIRAAEARHKSYEDDYVHVEDPFKRNPALSETLPNERHCSETVEIALPNYHYWMKNGTMIDLPHEVFEQEYFSTFPTSFQFLLREAACVSRCSVLDLYFELNELEKIFLKSYRRIK